LTTLYYKVVILSKICISDQSLSQISLYHDLMNFPSSLYLQYN